jgi:hypothetical protein
LSKINDFENQISDNDINNLNKSLTKVVERIDNNQFDNLNVNTNYSNQSKDIEINTDDVIGLKPNDKMSNTKNLFKKIKNAEVDAKNMKIDREIFYKFKNNTTHEFTHYCRIKNNTLELRKIIIGGFSFEDKNTTAKVVYCCNDLKYADMKGYDDLYEAKVAYAQSYNLDNL